MRILFFCTVNITRPIEAGVTKKALAQRRLLERAGHKVYFACRQHESDMVVLSSEDQIVDTIKLSDFSKLKRDRAITLFIGDFALKHNVDAVYARYGTFSLAAYRLYSNLHRNKIIVLLEIATYPLNQRWNVVTQSLKMKDFKTALVWIHSNTIGSLGILFFKKSVDAIVNNNGFKKIWGIPVIPISNGIDVSSIPDKQRVIVKKGSIHIMSVANIANWHGFDRIIKGLAKYYEHPRDVKIYFEVAGPGAEAENLTKLATNLNVSEYVKFVGPKMGEELDKLFDHSDLGVSVLGVHRVNMKECDSLKAREFCARRLPFITQEAESQYKGQPFTLCVPSNDSPIDMEVVVDFYNRIVNEPMILDEMRMFAERECDWTKAFGNVLDFFER